MFETVRPEEAGVSSRSIRKYIGLLERYQLSTHDVVMVRGGKVFYEAYWKPFHRDYLHRMYSVTKSFVSIAIGFLEQDGLIDLDAPVTAYLKPAVWKNAMESTRKQTVRDMLMMATGSTQRGKNWLERRADDRLRDYFDAASEARGQSSRVPGTMFEYDSTGSFVLGCVVEELTGKPLLDYLREKVLDRIGFSREAFCLRCPGGHSWGDSALICTARDLARTVQFLMNGGSWEGEQILNRDYVKKATGNQISTDETGFLSPDSYGYGYQIWRGRNNSFYFNGMGCQFGIAVPDRDLVFVINSDNQGADVSRLIIDRFFEEIAEPASESPLPEDPEAFGELSRFTEALQLRSLSGSLTENAAAEVSGREYRMEENPMGITRMRFDFEPGGGTLSYTNAQGDKTLRFGINRNEFGLFPQEGYSDLVGSEFAPGHYYKCAASAAWTHPRSLSLLVQIIDNYFGRMFLRAAFTETGELSVSMYKIAEDFLQEYEGYARGREKTEG